MIECKHKCHHRLHTHTHTIEHNMHEEALSPLNYFIIHYRSNYAHVRKIAACVATWKNKVNWQLTAAVFDISLKKWQHVKVWRLETWRKRNLVIFMETQSAPLVGENFWICYQDCVTHWRFLSSNSITIRHQDQVTALILRLLFHLFINEASRGGLLYSIQEIPWSIAGNQVWGCQAKLNSAFQIVNLASSVSSIRFACQTSHGSAEAFQGIISGFLFAMCRRKH